MNGSKRKCPECYMKTVTVTRTVHYEYRTVDSSSSFERQQKIVTAHTDINSHVRYHKELFSQTAYDRDIGRSRGFRYDWMTR